MLRPRRYWEEAMSAKWIRLAIGNLAVFALLLILAELILQAIALVRPSYEVLFLQPDRTLGWKHVPGHRWQWSGHHWYANEFSVTVQSNANGFRDAERAEAKPPGVRRVALLGDSFIEAVQVPMDQTASQRLEALLNAKGQARWEALNFGVSNFGQYWLTWDHKAKRFDPDVVAVLVARLHLQRTVSKFESGAFRHSSLRSLWVRPVFRLNADQLVHEPAADFEEFKAMQDEVIRTEFNGDRSRKRWQILTLHYGRWLKSRVFARHPEVATRDATDENGMRAVGLRVIKDLGLQVAARGARFVVIDVSRYFGDDAALASALEQLSRAYGFDYVPAYQDLLSASQQGVETRFRYDGHLTAEGNAILAKSVFKVLDATPAAKP
jgi:hypothetical protein